MGLYNEAQQAQQALKSLIDTCIEQHPAVKSAIKARKATVTTAANGTTVGITLIGENKELFLPYNSAFSTTDLSVGTTVSVWYNYSLNNGIVMQNAEWTANKNKGILYSFTGTHGSLDLNNYFAASFQSCIMSIWCSSASEKARGIYAVVPNSLNSWQSILVNDLGSRNGYHGDTLSVTPQSGDGNNIEIETSYNGTWEVKIYVLD